MSDRNIKLADGNLIPAIGLGLWKVTNENEFNSVFENAVKVGYRHFDSAQAYNNEQTLGGNWKKAGLNRQDIFITTKIQVQNLNNNKRLESLDISLKKLQTDYVDLLLIHFPGPPWLRQSQWQLMEKIKKLGLAKSIGVSNYTVKQLETMKSYVSEMPVVNQIEMHIFLQQQDTRSYCKQNGIVVEAYSPLAHGRVMNEPIIDEIAKKHGKSYAQILLRWCVDNGAVPLPKTVSAERIKENYNIFDFKLDKNDLIKIEKLDRKLRTLWRSALSN